MERLPATANTYRDYSEEERYIQAKKHVEKIKGFYIHFAVYIIINIFLLIVIAANLDKGESFWQFGHFATAFFWGIGLVFHAMGVFLPDVVLGKKWEERKMREYMDRNERTWE